MKYLKFTYVDAVTGISIADAPAAGGPAYPAVDGLEFVWARESQYPTNTPEFFGTCPDESDTAVPGVLAVLPQADWEVMRQDELRARIPHSVTMRQARLALLAVGRLADVSGALAALPEPDRSAAEIEWEYALTVERNSPLTVMLAAALALTDAEIDALFVDAARL